MTEPAELERPRRGGFRRWLPLIAAMTISLRCAIASGFSGALSGPATIPKAWIETVDRAEQKAVHTVSHLSCRETAEGLYKAALGEMENARRHISYLEASINAS